MRRPEWRRPSRRPAGEIGSTLGVAVIGAVLASGVNGATHTGGFAGASRTAWWIITACGVAVLAFGLLTSGKWAQRSARRTAERLDAPETAQTVADANA